MALPQFQATNESNASRQDPKLRGEYGGAGQPKGTPGFVSDSFQKAGDYITAGSAMAEGDIKAAYADLYRHRAAGLVAGSNEERMRLSADAASQGLSPELARRISYAGEAKTIGAIGAARGETGAALGFDLAGLHKGTATELATLTREEGSTLMENYLQSKARKAARSAAKKRFVMDLIGVAARGASAVASGGASEAAGAAGSMNTPSFGSYGQNTGAYSSGYQSPYGE